MAMPYEPHLDGVDHINIYSKSPTKLGRALSNFFHSTFIHPRHGMFHSVEGFYYWLVTGETMHALKELHGFKAKEYGEKFGKTRKIDKRFKAEIQEAIAYKIISNDYIQELLLDPKNQLPFTHYYFYGSKFNPKVYDMSKRDHYLIEACEEIRRNILNNGKIC
jgi:hypothetical protein